jgi:hypothetical protein
MKPYIPLETELIECFEKRGIKVKEIRVLKGCKRYIIMVER